MRRRTEIRTTRASAYGNILGGILFILLGLGVSAMIGGLDSAEFGSVMGQNGPAVFFGLFGLAGGGLSIVYGLYSLKRGGLAEHVIVSEIPPRENQDGSADPAGRLKKLKSLLDEGILTAAEYEAKKKEILSKKW